MSDTPMKLVVDCVTGEQQYIPLTEEELAQRELDIAQAEAERLAREAAEQAKADAKASAQAKLAALGLSEEELQALLG